MPVLDTITICTYTPGSGSFEHANPNLQPATGSPDWFSLVSEGVNIITGDTYYVITVDPVPDADTYSISIVNELDVEVGTVTVNVQECAADEEHTLCMGTYTGAALAAPGTIDGDTWVMSSGPNWFTLNSAAFDHSYEFIPSAIGTFIVVLSAASDPTVVYRIEITVTNCFTLYDACARREINIVWFLPEGGWRNYVFQGKKVYGVEIGSSELYEDENEVLKNISVEDVRDSVEVASGTIPKSHVDYCKLLKASIQAYVWDITLGTFTEIVIDKTSFRLYEDGDNTYAYNFKFVYGEKITIQNH